MKVNIQAIFDNLRQVCMAPSSTEILCEFERVIDENGLYAFENWKDGELISGPNCTPYRVQCSFYWLLSRMPDPSGASRLIPYGVKINYRKGWLVYPVKVKSEDDYRDGIKKPKLVKTRIWIVDINMPKYLMKDIKQGSEEIMRQELSFGDISKSYENNVNGDDDSTENTMEENPLGI
jgi:hypothetical protein